VLTDSVKLAKLIGLRRGDRLLQLFQESLAVAQRQSQRIGVKCASRSREFGDVNFGDLAPIRHQLRSQDDFHGEPPNKKWCSLTLPPTIAKPHGF